MEFFINCRDEKRHYPSSYPISSIGWMPRKRTEVTHGSFTTINFSLILSGRGYYYVEHDRRELVAPFVITQYPGRITTYGPYDYWSELFLIFDASLVPAFEQANIYDYDLPLWKVSELGPLQSLQVLCERLHRGEAVDIDLLDRFAEQTLVQSLLHRERPLGSPAEQCLRAFEKAVWAQPKEPPVLEQFCRSAGMSTSSFRRAWALRHEVSPHQYVVNVRVRLARRRLLESLDPIANIAYDLGFEDPLYFSRVFKKANEVSPREYRNINRSFSAQLNR